MRTQAMKNLIYGCFGMLVVFSAGSLTVHAEESELAIEATCVESTNNYGVVDVSNGASALEADAKAEYNVGSDSEQALAIVLDQGYSGGLDNNNIGYEGDSGIGFNKPDYTDDSLAFRLVP